MKQAELEVVSLDEPISQWVDIPYGDQITIRMLLNHTSGLPSYTESIPFLLQYIGAPQRYWHPEELLHVIRNKPLKFPSGTQHEYSNSNYLILGMILEDATQKPYESLVQELVEDVGLDNTFARNYPQGIPIANGYDQSIFHLGIRNLTGMRTSLVSGAFAAGDVLSTSSDVAEFVHALFSEQIISNATLSEMTAGIIAPDEDVPEQLEYGLGLRILQIDNDIFIGHTGTIPGYSGIAMHNREEGITIIILSNRSVIEQTKLFSELHLALRDSF
ncbi:MAG TPA: serine hydrolase domain-containing protein, partial [Anaerolineaceae bacterium]|nr:serine hydrolase domain-containing protein [Anaerolineaceae bacterium]